jgi:hypothetical protein
MTVLSIATSVAWLAGATAVTVGAAADEPELHPAARPPHSTAAKHAKYLERFENVFIYFP